MFPTFVEWLICFYGELKMIIFLVSSNTHVVCFPGFVIDWFDQSSKNTRNQYTIKMVLP